MYLQLPLIPESHFSTLNLCDTSINHVESGAHWTCSSIEKIKAEINSSVDKFVWVIRIQEGFNETAANVRIYMFVN